MIIYCIFFPHMLHNVFFSSSEQPQFCLNHAVPLRNVFSKKQNLILTKTVIKISYLAARYKVLAYKKIYASFHW